MFDGFLMSGGQLIHDTNFQILLMGNVFSCLCIIQLRWYPECLIISWVRLVIWDTWSMMVDLRHGSRTAAKRLGAGGPSPGGGPAPWPSRKAFGLRRDGGVLAWELGKSCGCGQINQDKSFSQVKNNTHGICHAEFSISGQVWQVNAHGCDVKDPIWSDMFPFFKLWTHICNKSRKSLRSTTYRLYWQ